MVRSYWGVNFWRSRKWSLLYCKFLWIKERGTVVPFLCLLFWYPIRVKRLMCFHEHFLNVTPPEPAILGKNKSVNCCLPRVTKIGGRKHVEPEVIFLRLLIVGNLQEAVWGKLQPQKIDSTALWQCQQKLNIIFIKVVFIAGLLCWIALDYTVLPVTVSTFCSVWPLAGIMCLRTVRVVLRLANCKKKLLSEKISCISFQALTLEKQKVQRCTFSLTE